MGADSSKEESRSNTPEQSRQRNQYVRQQRRQEPAYQAAYQSPTQAHTDRPRAPYGYTAQHLQAAVKQDSPNVLERPRAPYNYSSQQLQNGSNQPPNLYPNLNVHEDGYVYVQRSTPQPSAPPASDVNASPKVPPRSAQLPATRSTRESALLELPKAPSRPSPPQTTAVPNIPPTIRPAPPQMTAVPNIPPTIRPAPPQMTAVPNIPPTTGPSSPQMTTVPNIPPTSEPSSPQTTAVPNIPPTTGPSTPQTTAAPNITPTTQPSPHQMTAMPNIPPTTRPSLPQMTAMPNIPPTTGPSPPQTTAVPNIPPTIRPSPPETTAMPNILPTTGPSSPQINAVPNIPPTIRSSPPQTTAVPNITPTTQPSPHQMTAMPNIAPTTGSSPLQMTAMSNIPPTIRPSPPQITTVPTQSSILPTKTSLFNLSESPATQSEVEDLVSQDVFRRSTQSSAQYSSPNAPGPSKSTNSSANKNKLRPSASTKNRTDSYSCPSCGQRLGLTIYQCLGGHSCCKGCRDAVRACGTCHSAITDMRNITLEAFLAEIASPCQNPGCTLSFNACEMDRHRKECPFGDMDCPMGTLFGQCSTRCKVADMAAHFDACHKDQRAAEIDKEMYVFNICMETHKLFFIKNGPFNFLVHVKVHERERKISMAVQLLGTKISAGKWSYEFHVYNKRQPLRKYLYVDSCQSVSTPVDDIFREGMCATLPLSYAMTFVNESALTYKFYIKKEMNPRARRPRNNAAK